MKKGLFSWISFTAAIFVGVVVFMPCAEAREHYVSPALFDKFIVTLNRASAQIAASVSPAFEASEKVDAETQKELGWPPELYGRVWKNDKTCVLYAYDRGWKKPVLAYFETRDPSLSFAGGICVGANPQQLEAFFKLPLKNFFPLEGGEGYCLQDSGVFLSFSVQDGRISEISFGAPEWGLAPERAWKFVSGEASDEQSLSNNADEEDELDKELARLAEEFAREKRLPPSVTAGGDIYVIRSYVAQFKAIKGRGANLYALPDEGAKVVVPLKEGAALTAEAEWTARDARGSWYYVTTKKGHSGWVPAQFITDREAE